MRGSGRPCAVRSRWAGARSSKAFTASSAPAPAQRRWRSVPGRAREVEAILRIAGLLELFAVIVTADDVATAKPDPTGYRLAAAKLGLEPAACCTIEDTDKGIAAAKAAGYRAIGVMHTLPRERLHAADLVLAHIREAKPEHFGLR